MKKFFALLAVLLIAALPLAGCAKEPETPPDSFTVASLKGPTSMGLVKLMSDSDAGTAAGSYDFTIYGTADEIVPGLTSGDIDVACIPANLASVLYNRTEGGITVAAVNTLGVLYIVSTDESITSIADLAGRTVYSTGKGTTPEYVLNYLLAQNGLTAGVDVEVEYKSEATEVAAMIAEGGEFTAVLPQPYVSVVTAKNPNVKIVLDLDEQMRAVTPDGSGIVTGVVAVNSEFLAQYPETVAAFLDEYAASVEWVNANTADAAALIEQYDIVAAAVAEKALPYCSLTFLSGDEMRSALSGYLQVLYDQNADSVGGALPDDDFYYAG